MKWRNRAITYLTKVANLLRVELLSAKLGSFIVSKFFMLVKALELIAKVQAVGRGCVLAEASVSLPVLVKSIVLNLMDWKALIPIEVNDFALVKLAVLSEPHQNFLPTAQKKSLDFL